MYVCIDVIKNKKNSFAFHSFSLLTLSRKRVRFLTRSFDNDKRNVNYYFESFNDNIFEN